MNKKIQLSDDLFVLIFRSVSVLFILFSLIAFYFREYELGFSMLIVSLFWILKGNLFKLKSVSFDETTIFVDKETFSLDQIEKIEFNVLSNTYIQINSVKYFFLAVGEEFGFTNNRKLLQKYMAHVQDNPS